MTSAATFPTYPVAVNSSSPEFYHRLDDSASSAATSAVADSSTNARPGTSNGLTNGPCLWWQLDEGSGSTTADFSGGANPGTLNAASWTTSGHPNDAVSFNGSSSYLSAARQATPTDQSFTAAAWAFLTSNTANGTVLSQPGTYSSGFSVTYDAGSNRWLFRMPRSDTVAPVVDSVASTSAPSLNTWVHLAVVFDASTTTMALYVNGVAQGTGTTHTAVWNAPGALQAGRTWWDGAWGSWWSGRIDDVRVYPRALTASDLAELANDGPALKWDFDNGSGLSTPDSSGNGYTGSLNLLGPSWTSTGHSGSAVSFNGLTGDVTGSSSALRTDQSFTVSAWVYLTSRTSGQVLSKDGLTISSFYLYYSQTSDRWGFDMYSADTVLSTLHRVTGTSTPALNTWTQLAAVYDAAGGTMTLYVNGIAEGSTSNSSPWNGIGSFVVGRALWNLLDIQTFSGSIDSVRAYQRALSAADIDRLYHGLEPGAPMSAGLTGALQGAQQGQGASTAFAFAGSAGGYNSFAQSNPTSFTVECWFRVSGTLGGQLIGFNASTTAESGSTDDRMVYVDSGGHLVFGVSPGSPTTISTSGTVNDGTWHYLAASLGAAGMQLYVDGALVAADPAVTTAGNYTGYWRWGGGSLAGWPNRPASDYFLGTLDEIAVYPAQLDAQTIAIHYHSNH